MDIVVVIAIVVALALVSWLLLRRRTVRAAPVERPAPPAPPSQELIEPTAPATLDRSMLQGRSTGFDPHGWDDSPDPEPTQEAPAGEDVEAAGSADDAAADLPRYFDRDYLKGRERGGPQAQEEHPNQ